MRWHPDIPFCINGHIPPTTFLHKLCQGIFSFWSCSFVHLYVCPSIHLSTLPNPLGQGHRLTSLTAMSEFCNKVSKSLYYQDLMNLLYIWYVSVCRTKDLPHYHPWPWPWSRLWVWNFKCNLLIHELWSLALVLKKSFILFFYLGKYMDLRCSLAVKSRVTERSLINGSIS